VQARQLAETKNQLNRQRNAPVLFGEGDSWFRFPFPLVPFPVHNLLEGLRDADYVVEGEDTSQNGDTVANMSQPANLAFLATPLQAYQPDGFLFSGGGNDLFTETQHERPSKFHEMLRQRAAGPPQLDAAILGATIDRLKTGYRAVIGMALDHNVPVVLHTYGLPIPSGIPALASILKATPQIGPWIRPVLKDRGYNPDQEGGPIVAELLQAFKDMLHQVGRPGVTVVDLSRVIIPDLWHDELHLISEGWKRCAQAYVDTFRMRLPSSGPLDPGLVKAQLIGRLPALRDNRRALLRRPMRELHAE
jgi:hypothetical protein